MTNNTNDDRPPPAPIDPTKVLRIGTNDQADIAWREIASLAELVVAHDEHLDMTAFLHGLEASLLHLRSILAVAIGESPGLTHDDLVRVNNRHLVDALRNVTLARGHYDEWRSTFL